MKIAPKLALALTLAMLTLPTVTTTAVYADDNQRDFCEQPENRDKDECKREKPKFQTRFFDE